MWKKEEEQTARPQGESTSRVATPRPTTRSPQSSGRATIGPSIQIRGDVTGSEDLLIQGRVEGSVTLADHSVGVGSEGRVTADVVGRLITIEGHVEGNLTAQEQIVLRGSAHVKGDIKAPRVVLEDGATFRGLVDMGASDVKSAGADKSTSGNGADTGTASKVEAGTGSAVASGASASTRSTSAPKGSVGGASGAGSASSGTARSSSGRGKDASKSADQASA